MDSADLAAPTVPVRLVSLSGLRHINALTDGQRIEFHPNLTLIFGENGAGKSGYARCLKLAADARSAETILPNVALGATGTPEATFEVTVGSEQKAVHWHNERGLPPLTAIDVFDNRAVVVHLDEDLAYTVTPPEMALFQATEAGIEAVRRLLDEEVDGAKPAPNPYAALVSRASTVAAVLETLSAATIITPLETYGTVKASDPADRRSLQGEIRSLESSRLGSEQKLLATRLDLMGRLRTFTLVGSKFNPDVYDQARRDVNAAQAAADDKAAALLRRIGRDDLSRETREFIDKGEALVAAHYDEGEFPSLGAKCPYCQHPLDADAVDLVRNYRDVAAGAERRKLASAQESLRAAVASVSSLNPQDMVERLQALDDTAHPVVMRALAVCAAISAVITTIESGGLFDGSCTLPSEAAAFTTEVDAERNRITTLQAGIRGDEAERQRMLREKQAALSDIEERAKVAAALPEIRKWVDASRWVAQASAYLPRFTVTLRALTTQAKEAADAVLNAGFEAGFAAECAALNAPTVRLEFPGRQGIAKRKKVVAVGYRPTQIYSEGEQRVVAFADFLAEIRMKAPAPVVLDDPVNSLDARRLGLVGARIMRLAEERQVVLFTHNIMLAAKIMQLADDRPELLRCYGVRREGAVVGLVTEGEGPKVDSWKQRRGRINAAVQQMRAMTGSERDRAVAQGYELLRGACEILVEHELLKGVTRRFEPDLRMTLLAKLPVADMPWAITEITEVFDQACRAIESHSQPLETLGALPTLDELAADWARLEEVHKRIAG